MKFPKPYLFRNPSSIQHYNAMARVLVDLHGLAMCLCVCDTRNESSPLAFDRTRQTPRPIYQGLSRFWRALSNTTMPWGLVCLKQVSSIWINDYIADILWNETAYVRPRYLSLDTFFCRKILHAKIDKFALKEAYYKILLEYWDCFYHIECSVVHRDANAISTLSTLV